MGWTGVCAAALSRQVISVAFLGFTLRGPQVVPCEVSEFMVAELQRLPHMANEALLSAALNHCATHQV